MRWYCERVKRRSVEMEKGEVLHVVGERFESSMHSLLQCNIQVTEPKVGSRGPTDGIASQKRERDDERIILQSRWFMIQDKV